MTGRLCTFARGSQNGQEGFHGRRGAPNDTVLQGRVKIEVLLLFGSFYGAYRAGEGRTACDLLAPATREEVETSAQAPCAEGVVDERLPGAGSVRRTAIYGDQGQVRLERDTVFVAEFPGGWKVVAAGCTAQPSGPYDCELEAG
jgi:hypothetical protein